MSRPLKQIKSFQIDHTKLLPGLYLSRFDDRIYTYDLRVCKPNVEYMDGAAAHTIEHLAATYLRSNYDGIVYFGPMGCMTGFYLLCTEANPNKVKEMALSVFRFIADFDGTVIGASEKECGNYKYHDLQGAKIIAAKYVQILNQTNKYNYD